MEGVVRLVFTVLVAMVISAFDSASAVANPVPSATIAGTVTLAAADGSTWAGDGARVVLVCEADSVTRTEVADGRGMFRFVNVPVDSCSIEADVQGFLAQPVTVVTAAEPVGIDLQLDVAPLGVGVNVGGATCSHEPKILPGSCRSDTGRRVERSAKRCSP
jgi:hypothetical protein